MLPRILRTYTYMQYTIGYPRTWQDLDTHDFRFQKRQQPKVRCSQDGTRGAMEVHRVQREARSWPKYTKPRKGIIEIKNSFRERKSWSHPWKQWRHRPFLSAAHHHPHRRWLSGRECCATNLLIEAPLAKASRLSCHIVLFVSYLGCKTRTIAKAESKRSDICWFPLQQHFDTI